MSGKGCDLRLWHSLDFSLTFCSLNIDNGYSEQMVDIFFHKKNKKKKKKKQLNKTNPYITEVPFLHLTLSISNDIISFLQFLTNGKYLILIL